MSLDVTTGELFVSVGNPWPDIDKAYRPGDNLFTDSVVVLDARTGALKWWHQLAPGDWMDLDLVAAPMLYRANGAHDYMAIGGKDGYVTVVDRDTHKRVFRTPVTTVEQIFKEPSREGSRMCPGYAGRRGMERTGAGSFEQQPDPSARWTSVSSSNSVTRKHIHRGQWTSVETVARTVRQPAGFTALDRETGAVRWKYHAEKARGGGHHPTAGGVTFRR